MPPVFAESLWFFVKRVNVLFLVCRFMSLEVLGTSITTMMSGHLM